jgi:hypothetical protein
MNTEEIKILFIGDIVGRPGRNAVKELLPELVEKHSIDFVIANGENLSGGSGMTFDKYKEMIDAGIDLFTTGNHIWKNKDIIPHLDDPDIMVLRPVNYPKGVPGRGMKVLEKKGPKGAPFGGKKLLVVNLQGRVFMADDVDEPFSLISKYSDDNKDLPILVDFHAEATSEKVALVNFLDGKVSAVVGTHTHVQTSDEKILPRGTGYITDVGMVGPEDSVLGVEKEIIIEKFLTQLPVSHKVATGAVEFGAVILTIDQKDKKTKNILRIKEILKLNR